MPKQKQKSKSEIKMGKPRRIYSAEVLAKHLKKTLPKATTGGKKQTKFGTGGKQYKF